MISAALERIKELETELREKDVAYNAMKAQRDALAESCRDALNWIECDTRSWIHDHRHDPDTNESLDYLEKILKEYLK